MKNMKLLKVLGITAAIVVFLTWIIPSSTYNGSSVTMDVITPAGIWDWINGLGISLSYFWQGGLFLLILGGFYGILMGTGLLKSIISSIEKNFKGKESWFLIITIAMFMVVSSLTGIYLPLFVAVPLFIAIILAMGYSKIIALVSTIGSIILGNICLIYNGPIQEALSIEGVPNFWYKLILLVLITGLTITYVLKTSKDKKEKEEIDKGLLLFDKATEVKGKKKALWPLVTILSLIAVLLILGMTPWSGLFGGELFTKMHTSIMGVKIGNFPIFQNILGTAINPFGSWNLIDIDVILVIASLVIGIIYKTGFKGTVENFVEGAKKLLPTALLIIFVNIIIVFTLNSGFFTTVMNALVGLTDKLNLLIMSFLTFVGSILSIDNAYVANYNMGVIAAVVDPKTSMPLLALIQQTMYGMAMLVAPTSVLLLAGLSYLEVPYSKWLKYIWRLFLMVLIIVVIILVVASLL